MLEGPSTPFLEAVANLFNKLEQSLGDFQGQIVAVVAGGTAVHWYTRERSTDDVDAEFSHKRFLISDDFVVRYTDELGNKKDVYLDRNYNPMFSLLHEDYLNDSVDVFGKLGGGARLQVKVLSPLDLAVSKLARWAELDQSDVEALARKGLIDPDKLEQRASEALKVAVGCNASMVAINIQEAVSRVRRVVDQQ